MSVTLKLNYNTKRKKNACFWYTYQKSMLDNISNKKAYIFHDRLEVYI